METLEHYQSLFVRYYDIFEFIPSVLLLNTILLTYCWSMMNKKIQCILFFIFGFAYLGPPISFFVNFFLPPEQSEETLILIGGLTGGFIGFVGYWIGWLLTKILLMIGDAILPILIIVFFVLLKIFDQLNNIELIAIGIISMLCGFILFKLNQYKIVEIVTSAIGGAVSIGYLFLWTEGLSNFEILNQLKKEGIYLLKNITDEYQAAFIII